MEKDHYGMALWITFIKTTFLVFGIEALILAFSLRDSFTRIIVNIVGIIYIFIYVWLQRPDNKKKQKGN